VDDSFSVAGATNVFTEYYEPLQQVYAGVPFRMVVTMTQPALPDVAGHLRMRDDCGANSQDFITGSDFEYLSVYSGSDFIQFSDVVIASGSSAVLCFCSDAHATSSTGCTQIGDRFLSVGPKDTIALSVQLEDGGATRPDSDLSATSRGYGYSLEMRAVVQKASDGTGCSAVASSTSFLVPEGQPVVQGTDQYSGSPVSYHDSTFSPGRLSAGSYQLCGVFGGYHVVALGSFDVDGPLVIVTDAGSAYSASVPFVLAIDGVNLDSSDRV
jgi:hypothetical protein